MNICKNCKHFIYNGPIWYDQYCRKATIAVTIHPQTGEPTYRGINDLGGTYYSDRPYHYARDINKEGDCRLYEEI